MLQRGGAMNFKNKSFKETLVKDVLFGAITISIASVIGIGIKIYFAPSFLYEYRNVIAFLFIFLPLIAIMISLPLYVSSLKQLQVSSIMRAFDIIEEYLGSECSYTFQSTLKYSKLSEDPSLTSHNLYGGYGDHMLCGSYGRLNYSASNFETYPYQSSHCQTDIGQFSGFYILVRGWATQSEPAHVSTRNFFRQLDNQIKNEVNNGECMAELLQTAYFEGPLRVYSSSGRSDEALLRPANLESIRAFAEKINYDFSIFCYENGDIGVAIKEFKIFMVDGTEEEGKVRKVIKGDVELVQSLLSMVESLDRDLLA